MQLSAEVLIEDALAEVGLAPFRLKMRRKIFDTLTLEFTDGDRLREWNNGSWPGHSTWPN